MHKKEKKNKRCHQKEPEKNPTCSPEHHHQQKRQMEIKMPETVVVMLLLKTNFINTSGEFPLYSS